MFKDKRSGKIALVAHCLLNQNSRAIGLARRPSAINGIIKFLMCNEIGIIQMPCPELAYAGALREPKTKEQYDNAKFRRCCRKMAGEIANQVREYESCGVKLKVVLGVDGSPSCGVNEMMGIFVEELRSALEKIGVSVPFHGVSLEQLRADIVKLEGYVK
ncbi:MAG: CD3072 family TudS-related putative desulfidase [Candidatus Bathycorpusculaceae bacterium]